MSHNPTENLVSFLNRTGNLLIHLLDTCNLHCQHCYLDANAKGSKILPLELVERTLDEANELNIKSVQFSGGEPFLHPDITEVLRSTIRKNFSVTVSTNGTLLDDEHAALLSDINTRVVTSIDGPPEYHDRFRGRKGSFSKTEKNVVRLIEMGVPVNIVTTVCEDSLEYVEWCADYAYKIKADSIQFQPLEKVGRGKSLDKKRLHEEQLHNLFIQLNDLSVFYAQAAFQVKMSYQSRKFMLAHPCTAFVCNGKKCHRGVEKELKKIVIREDGMILPELVDIDRRFVIGNLFDDTLRNHLTTYLNKGYAQFDQLCRKVYKDAVLDSRSPLISWNEILTEKSKEFEIPERTIATPIPVNVQNVAKREKGSPFS